MPAKKTAPEWALEATATLTDEILEHIRLSLPYAEKTAGHSRGIGFQGELQPALIMALIEQLTPALNKLGQEAVKTYTEDRKADTGQSARKTVEKELAPIMGMTRAGVMTAFGYQRRKGAAGDGAGDAPAEV